MNEYQAEHATMVAAIAKLSAYAGAFADADSSEWALVAIRAFNDRLRPAVDHANGDDTTIVVENGRIIGVDRVYLTRDGVTDFGTFEGEG